MTKEEPQVPVIMFSGHGTIETAIRAIQQGAYDFIEAFTGPPAADPGPARWKRRGSGARTASSGCARGRRRS